MLQPSQVTGIGPGASWLARLNDYVKSLRILPGNGYRVKQCTNGVILELLPHGGIGSKGISITQYTFLSHNSGTGTDPTHGDYISCAAVGAKATDPPSNILKPSLLWFSTASRTVQGQTINYSQWDAIGQSRVAQNLVGSITQYITPAYASGDIIWTVPATLNGKSVQMDLNVDGRVFAAP